MYRRKNKGWLKHLDFIILDLLCLPLKHFKSIKMLRETTSHDQWCDISFHNNNTKRNV